jgi:hypothetical protein
MRLDSSPAPPSERGAIGVLHPSSLGWMEQENNRQTDPGIGQ